MFNSLWSKVVGFVRAHGLQILTTYVGSVVTLVLSHTTSAGNGAILSLFVAAALATAKSLNAPGWLTDFLVRVGLKAPPTTPGK